MAQVTALAAWYPASPLHKINDAGTATMGVALFNCSHGNMQILHDVTYNDGL